MKQLKDGWCGPTSLTYVAKKHGIPMTQHRAARLTGTTVSHGVDPKGMMAGARKAGFTVSSIANKLSGVTLSKIKRALSQNKSVIVDYLTGPDKHMDGHYSVVTNVGKRRISLWDPEQGKVRTVAKPAFISSWKDTTKNGGMFSRWAAILS